MQTEFVELFSTFEPGVSVKFSTTGQFVLALNTPAGRVYQETTLHPLMAEKLMEFLNKQSWVEIRRAAVSIDASLAELWPIIGA